MGSEIVFAMKRNENLGFLSKRDGKGWLGLEWKILRYQRWDLDVARGNHLTVVVTL